MNNMVETVTIEKYKSLNGYTYDKLADAERADAEWRKENEYDLEKDITRLVKLGERDQRYLLRTEEQRKYSQFPLMLVLEGKWDSRYYVATKPDTVPRIYFEILKFNKECGFYYSPAAVAITDEIVRTENLLAAMAFVKERVDYQYEKVYTEDVTIY